MTRKLLAMLAVGVLAAAPCTAAAQISTGVSLAGGLAMPSGKFGDGYESGYNGALGLNIGVPLLPVGVRIEGAYNGFEAKNEPTGTSASANIMSGTVNGTFGLGLPYLIGGLGYYRLQGKNTGLTGTTVTTTENAMGLNGGVGMTFPLGLLSTFAEIRYHKMMGDAAKGTDRAYIPITFGIKF